ncbi:MAG: N-acetyltransferase family protein [Spirulina sp. DLM2.Bin59]|nr:MAG: N-acetyltransferase family protein [Spirulina sp. DLM2.Bin59]
MIRLATPTDLPAIVAIYNQSIPGRQATADLEPITVESRRDWFAAHTPEKYPLWVMVKGDRPIAWLSFQAFYGRPAYGATAEISLYIDSSQQRQGFGRQLLEYGLAQAPVVGITTLLGFIFAHNAPSLALFEQYQFQEWGYLPRIARLDGRDADLVILGRRLEDSP